MTPRMTAAPLLKDAPSLRKTTSHKLDGYLLPNSEQGANVSPGGAVPNRQEARCLARLSALAMRTHVHLHHSIDEVTVSGADPVAVLEARDRLARIEQAVSRLKPLARQIFLARRVDGYSYAEIAQRTGLSVRGVEKQMSRAIRQLGQHLRHD